MLDPYEEHFFLALSNVWEAYVKGLIPDNYYITSYLTETNSVEYMRQEMSKLVYHHQKG